MEGRIWVESEVGAGSVFHFTVPARTAAAPGGLAVPGRSVRRDAPALVLDDLEIQRAILRRSLEEWGIAVVEAPSVEEARRAIAERRPGAGGGSAAERGGRPAVSLRILLAEDSLVNQRVTAGLLEARGHTVDVVANGVEAVAAAARRRYDLVLMDLQMPQMGGIEATTAIRRREAIEGGHLPIVALTARAMGEDRTRCFAAGMDGYLAKPLRHAELLALAEGLAAGRRAAIRDPGRGSPRPSRTPAPGARPAAFAGGGPAGSAAATSASDAPPVAGAGPVDWRAALARVDGDEALLARIVDATLEEAPPLLRELEEKLAARDAPGLGRAAHKLLGSLRSVGDDELLGVAEDLEGLARRGELEGAGECVAALEQRLAPVLAALREWRSGGRNSR